MITYYLSLGSNLGEREQTLLEAVRLIGQQAGIVTRCSSFYYSEPWGFESEHAFCNLCCCVETELEPMRMLAATQAVERALGRTHKSSGGHYSDRTIDIDLVMAFENEREIKVHIVNEQQEPVLILPHPLWQQRDFVCVPLREIKG